MVNFYDKPKNGKIAKRNPKVTFSQGVASAIGYAGLILAVGIGAYCLVKNSTPIDLSKERAQKRAMERLANTYSPFDVIDSREKQLVWNTLRLPSNTSLESITNEQWDYFFKNYP